MDLFKSHQYGEETTYGILSALRVYARDPQTIAKAWSTGLAGSRDKIKDGVEAVRVSPGTAAAAQADVWATNTAAAKDKFRKNVGAVQLGDWQAAMVNKGLDRIASGATQAEAKMATFMTKLLPYQQTLKGQLPKRGGLEQNIQRAVAWIRGMSQFSAV